MPNELILPLGVFLCIALLGGTAAFVFLQRRRRRRSWQQIGEELGLQQVPKEPIIKGRYRGFLVTAGIMSVEGGPHGGSESATTVVRASLPGSSPFTLAISKESALSKLGKLAGAEDLEVGDQRFDERFVVKTNNAPLAKELLSTPAREPLLKLDSERIPGVIRVKNNSVSWESREILLETSKIHAVLEVVVDMAQQLAALDR